MNSLTTAFVAAMALFILSCAADEPYDDADSPIAIDDELLKETFEECEVDIETCLDNPDVLAEIDQRVEDGEWTWIDDSEDDGTDVEALGRSERVVSLCHSTSARGVANAHRELRSRCYQRRGRGIGSMRLLYFCSSSRSLARFYATCFK